MSKQGLRQLGLVALLTIWTILSADAAQAGREKRPDVPMPASQTGSESAALETDARVVAYINALIARQWESAGVKPSARADDGEFLRRVYLDTVGHIPPLEVTREFVKSREEDKRNKIVDRLVADEDYVKYWSNQWANLLIGRETPRRVNRAALEKWLRASLARNKPYDRLVYELLSARGDYTENGAVNFLLSHLNDRATPATGRTARLFLGVQVQCTQCHDHPFNDWKQDQFWQFNAFFRQLQRRDHFAYSASSGRNEFQSADLVSGDTSGPVYFERRSALMSVAFPKFLDGTQVDDGAETDRLRELAELITKPENPWLARALVNRMWGHFFGHGFTSPVDDMGPHNPPSHPELLERLAQDFVASGYDLKRLIRWITASDAYQLTSATHPGNEKRDPRNDPQRGLIRLFSHMYVKQMSAEQLYDSLLVATQAHKAGRSDWEASERQRREWLRQFVVAFGTDENDETTTFDGTIPQALMMMNGSLMQKATGVERGGFLHQVLQSTKTDSEKIQDLYLASLARHPSPTELKAMQRIVRATGSDRKAVFEDLFWALLNSNEFILNH
jgi:hypothetical protein